MKAIQIKEYGPPQVLKMVELPQPVLKPNEVLIEVKAAGVNPFDAKFRSGMFKQIMPFTLPKTVGWDAAGIIVAVGDQVSRFKKGDEVFSVTSVNAGGSYATLMVAAENEVALKPRTLSFVEAAAAPTISNTAYTYLFKLGNLQQGQKILILGAAGGVGASAVQMAKIVGAEVTGIANTDDQDYLRELGADKTIDFTKPDYLSEVKDMDLILDVIGGPGQSKLFDLVKKGGQLVSTVQPPDEEKAKAAGIKVQFVSTKSDYKNLEKVTEWIDSGKLKFRVGTVLPLSEAVKAHELLEKGKGGGKIILEVV